MSHAHSPQGSRTASTELRQAAKGRPHLQNHLERFNQITGRFPEYTETIGQTHAVENPNVLYPVGGPIYTHIYRTTGTDRRYFAIEPTLTQAEQEVYTTVKDELLRNGGDMTVPTSESDHTEKIETLLSETVTIADEADESDPESVVDRIVAFIWGIVETYLPEEITVSEHTYESIQYRLSRDIVGFGPLEPVLRDSNNEDIHVIGPDQCHVSHSVFGLTDTSVAFRNDRHYESWLRNIGERTGDPLTDADPIVDSTLPDGSRLNVVYSDDVSVQGPSLTIRQGDDVPLSIAQITKWGTFSPELAAYLWLALENEQTVFVVGETASGKTTSLNALLSFIPRDSKIYTAEDTAEVVPPHDTWQQLLTRESHNSESQDVTMFDLVETALRSRPDYIIVGEVRGEEGRMAFQAAQTGHPIMLTFHASDIVSMIQRFTGDPINVPKTFIDNADIAIFQNRVKQDDEILRRVTSVQEIEGYSEELDGVVTRQAFYWDPIKDEIVFQGLNNSYVLEEQIATLLGYENTREIYDDVQLRGEILQQMIKRGILGYHEVTELIARFQRDGIDGLPFRVQRS